MEIKHTMTIYKKNQGGIYQKDLGPVVQSIASLKSWLRGQLIKCFSLSFNFDFYVSKIMHL